MKQSALTLFLFFSLFSSTALATGSCKENVTVLDESTFLKVGEITNDLETIQLFKVENNQIVLVDAIQIQEKTVNFKPLLEYVRLKIEEKDHL